MTATIAKTYRDGTITIKDAPAGGNSLVVSIEEGDLAFSETQNTNVIMDRGAMSGIRKGDDAPIEWSFSAKFSQHAKQTGETDPALREALFGVGAASAWVSVLANQSDRFAFDIQFDVTTPNTAHSSERILIENAWVESVSVSEGAEFDTIEISGRALGNAKTGKVSVAKV